MRQEKWLWSKKRPSRNAGRSRVRPRHGAARSQNHYEGNAHVPRYRFWRVREQLRVLLILFSFSILQVLFVVATPPLPRTQCILRACSVIRFSNSPYSSAIPTFPPYMNSLVFTSSDGWFFVSVQEFTCRLGLNVSPLSTYHDTVSVLIPVICTADRSEYGCLDRRSRPRWSIPLHSKLLLAAASPVHKHAHHHTRVGTST